jgi:predicted HTH transcriptional regulator
MTESQNIEYKTTWRDEYLKWICGFANANGGKLLIGIDDKGHVVGVDNYKRLMEEIPNKAVQHLGLAIETNLLVKEDRQYIEIIVLPSSLPISYHGVFHYRSGSTKFLKKKEVVEKVVEKVAEKVVENLTAHQKKIISSIIADPKITALEISMIIGLSHRKTQENIKKLKNKGILKRVGSAKGGNWEVNEK